MWDGQYQKAAERYKLLAEAVCSAPWMVAIAVLDSERETKERFRRLYPFVPTKYRSAAGDSNGRMQKCPRCERIAPHSDGCAVCIDCEVEQGESLLVELLVGADYEVEENELLKRWYRSPWCYRDMVDHLESFVGNESSSRRFPTTNDAETDSPRSPEDPWGVGRTAGEADRQADRGRILQKAYRLLGIQGRTIRLTDPVPLSSLSDLPRDVASAVRSIAARYDRLQDRNARAAAAALRSACRPLGSYRVLARRGEIVLHYAGGRRCLLRYGPDDAPQTFGFGSGRAVGCRATLLAESEKALRAEIDYFHRHRRKYPSACAENHIMPSAKRFTRLNPMGRAPEDGHSVMDCFVGTRGR